MKNLKPKNYSLKTISEGIMAVYKPKGPTSHDIINQLRKITGVRRIGHAGTLDPLARGVLVIGIGAEATKKLHEIVQSEKEYVAVVRLGMTSATDDGEGPLQKTLITNGQYPKQKDIEEIISRFMGSIEQTPPVYSALKIQGTPAYARARCGEKVEMKPRAVEIKELEIVSYAPPDLKFRVITGPGVYIRALARDIGNALGTGAYLADLERTRVGNYTKEQCLVLENMQ